MSERIAISTLGGMGFVGSRVSEELAVGSDFIVFNPKRENVDVRYASHIRKFVGEAQTGTIVNFAGYADVDGAQTDSASAYALNLEAPAQLALACRDNGKHLIHISSDFVFSGNPSHPGPYLEDAAPGPVGQLGEYGKSKLMGERAISEVPGLKSTIIRIAYPFGNYDRPEKDFILKLLSGMKKGYSIFNDQLITLTYLPDLARAIERVVRTKLTGILHVATAPATTPFAIAHRLATKLNLAPPTKGSFVGYYNDRPKLAKRPQQGGLLASQTEELLGINFHSLEGAIDEFISTPGFNW